MMIAKNKSRLVVLVLVASMLLQLMGSIAVFADDQGNYQIQAFCFGDQFFGSECSVRKNRMRMQITMQWQ